MDDLSKFIGSGHIQGATTLPASIPPIDRGIIEKTP